MSTTEDRFDEYVELSVERELLIARGVPEDDLLRPLYPLGRGRDEH